MTDWGVPDWRNSEAYPRPEELDLTGWRWQFVRRRHDYREYWDSNSPAAWERHRQFVELQRARGHDKFPLDPLGEGFSFKADDDAINAFGLEIILHPSLPTVPVLSPFLPQPGDGPLWRDRDEDLRAAAGGSHMVEFDLSLPLGPQLKRAKDVLEGWQLIFLEDAPAEIRDKARRKSKTALHVRKWPRYLRVVDGRDAGASWREIAETVLNCSEAQKARDVHAAAVRRSNEQQWG